MRAFRQRAAYSARADAVYVYLADGEVAQTQQLDHARNIDLNAAGNVVRVEFLGVSGGINLANIPSRGTVERLMEGYDFRVYA